MTNASPSPRLSRIGRPSLAGGMLALIAVLGAVGLQAEPSGITAVPLAHQPVSSNGPMFVRLDPAQCGVRTENRYSDPRMHGDLYQEFEGGAMGTGIAIGDYDGDGRPDIFVVSKTESCRLFRNLGGFRFQDVTDAAGVGDHGAAARIWKQGATFVDINNDGRLDLYVCRFNAPNLLYVNNGDGTFTEQAHAYGLDVTDSSVMAAFCDYDRDGRLDLYLAVNLLSAAKEPSGQRGRLLHNDGDGHFSEVTDRAGIEGKAQTHSATWWDYDGDGWPDLYVANDYGAPDKLYHNNRDGTFTDVIDRVLPHTAFSSMGSDFADVNNDGRIDFLVADMAARTHEGDQRYMAESRAKAEEAPEDSVALPKYHRNALLLATGMGHLQEAAFLAGVAATDWTWSPRFEDFDNDGRVDLFVTNGFPHHPSADVIRRMMSAGSAAERIRLMTSTLPQAEANIALRNLGDLQFEDVSAAWGLDHKGVSFGSATGDLDGDGNLDIACANYHDSAFVYRNDCATGHRIMIDLRGKASNRFGIGALVRVESALGVQASQLALARGYMSSSEPALHFGLGRDTVIRRLAVTWPSGRVQSFENLPVDQRYTITEPAASASPSDPSPRHPQFEEVSAASGLALASREESAAELEKQPLLPVRLDHRGPALAVGPLSPSGTAIVVGGTTLDPLRILQPDATGRFPVHRDGSAGAPGCHTLYDNKAGASRSVAGSSKEAEVDDGPVLLIDADGDGALDLLITKGGNRWPEGSPQLRPELWLNDGRGHFRAARGGFLPVYAASVGAAAAADFDRDGHVDVFIGGRVVNGRYPESPTSALWRSRNGRYEDVTDTFAPGLRHLGMVTDALWTDVDDDGWPDLLVTIEWGPVRYFHNRQGRGFDDWTDRSGFASAGAGWWTAIAAADFNGDGRMDFVVGNVGLNTQYHADAQHPAVLYAGDFKGDGSMQLIEGYYEGERLYPWRTRRDLGAVFPWVLKKYPWADDFAPRTLPEIFGVERLSSADRFAATELRSGVFLSRPDGSYRFEPLPRVAQISPVQAIVAEDFDGDGCADICVVQNSFAPIPAVGRFDGGVGQWLRGDGTGHFTAVAPADSGVVAPGDAQALVALDLDDDGWPDLLASQNNGATLAFRNLGRADRTPLSVELRGTAGNPTAIGTLLTLAGRDGTRQVREIHAGGGHYSQSSNLSFFSFAPANPPSELQVRWPDGRISTHPVPTNCSRVVISEPR